MSFSMSFSLPDFEDVVRKILESRKTQTWVRRKYIRNRIGVNAGHKMLNPRTFNDALQTLVKRGVIFEFEGSVALTNPWPSSNYDSLEPVVTTDIIIHEIGKYISLSTASTIGRVCKQLQSLWPRCIKKYPPSKMGLLDDTRLSLFVDLETLHLGTNSVITDSCLENLCRLTDLDIGWSEEITDEGLKKLSQLKILYLNWGKKITNDGISHLTKLEKLDLGLNELISNEGISGMKRLENLDLGTNDEITDDGISHLSLLHTLNLDENRQITNKGVMALPLLTKIGTSVNIDTNELLKYKNYEIFSVTKRGWH